MARHHFVPQFLLRRWAVKGKFLAYHLGERDHSSKYRAI